MRPEVPGAEWSPIAAVPYLATACGCGVNVAWNPPRRDDGKGDQFPDAPAGMREPRRPRPGGSGGAISLEVPVDA